MKVKFAALLGLLLLISPAMLFAGSACTAGAGTGPTILELGHKLDFDFVAPSGSAFYSVDLAQGNSYEFRVDEDYDDAKTSPDLSVFVYDVTNGATCATPLTVNAAPGSATTGVRDTSGMAPVVPFNAFRGSVIATGTGSYKIKVVNNDAVNGHYLSVRVSQTTLLSAALSTFSGYATYYSFVNGTGQGIQLNVKLFGPTGTQIGSTFTQVLNGGGNLSTNTSSMGVAANQSGYAVLNYDGPVGSVVAVSAIANFGINYVQPVEFHALHELQ